MSCTRHTTLGTLASIALLIGQCPRVTLADDDFIGVTYFGDIVAFDSATGECRLLLTSQLGGFNSMGRDAAGRLFTVNSDGWLLEIAPTGLSVVRTTFLKDLRCIAFEPSRSDILFAMKWVTGSRSRLYRIDLTQPITPAAATLIGETTSAIIGLAFSPSGLMYGWSLSEGLVLVDPLTAAIIDINPAVGAPVNLQSITFDANGLLWGVADQLYTIKLQTGEPQAVGQATCESVRGLETANGFCMADCDRSTGIGTLDVFDFLCFQDEFVRSRAYACDCDTSTGSGVCDIFDFLCFQTRFIGGCK